MNPFLAKLIDTYPDLEICLPAIERAAELLLNCYRQGGKLLVCGNGGSAADSEHIVGELMKGYLRRRPLPPAARQQLLDAFPESGNYLADHLQGALPAISLASQTALLTAYANDVAADMIFAQQVYGYGAPGDVLLGISTSGNSRNVVQAVQVARAFGLRTLGFTGQSGGLLRSICEVMVCVPREEVAAVQELQLPIYHALCALVEAEFFAP
jgi:D-sedoheptulose 7-phosphate isomerase